MVKTTKYSAGLVSQSFWFLEFKKALNLRREGLTYEEIKMKCVEENMFGAVNEKRALRMANYIITRIKTVDDILEDTFFESDITTQKLINLIAILRIDRMFLEFVYEIYREKVILGLEYLETKDVDLWFGIKETQNKAINKWQDVTKKRLCNVYISFMTDANLLAGTARKKLITPPILDSNLENYLKETSNDVIVKALTGER